MQISGNIFIFFTFVFNFGYGQKIDLSKHKDLILKLHNGYRGIQRASNMKQLRWSHKLAQEAEKWVGRCWYQYLAGSHGENMFYSESALPDNVLIERAIDTWYGEKYTWRRSGDCTDACSYTQMMWAKSSEIGCAAYRCASLNLPTSYAMNSWFITCFYSPKGNILGQMPFEIGTACTLCDLGERCVDNLCTKNTPVKAKVAVQNRQPPMPIVKPILTFDDVKKRRQDNQDRNGFQNNGFTPQVNNIPTPPQNIPTPPPDPLNCPDEDVNCKHWKQYCTTNQHVMKNCKGTCDTCPTPPPPPTPPPTPSCPDLDPRCHLWQSYCTQNNDYVREHCFKTCNNCTHAPKGELPMGFGNGFHTIP